jgi:hypothetical protein
MALTCMVVGSQRNSPDRMLFMSVVRLDVPRTPKTTFRLSTSIRTDPGM